LTHDSILIIDFGSQVTQLIARRVREIGVYCEIAPFQSASEAFQRIRPKGVIFSGGPASVPDEGSPRAPEAVFSSGLPVLGICYGQQTMAQQLGGRVESGHAAEFGRADVEIVTPSALFEGVWEEGGRYPVWMSHGDRVTQLPAGFSVKATSENAPYAVASDEERRFYSTMFHPEVVHTPDGGRLLRNFVVTICGCTPDWSMAAYRAEMQNKIRDQVGAGRVICVGAPEEPRLALARKFGAEATVNLDEVTTPEERIARVREIVGGFGADLVMDCSGHPSAGPEGIEFLRDGGTYVEMGQFTDAGSIQTNWHRICTKDLNVLGSWAFTGNDLPLGVDMLYRARDKYPFLEMQTLYPFTEAGVTQAVADAMAMKTVKSTIIPFPELV